MKGGGTIHMVQLPEHFRNRIVRILGDEAGDFFASYDRPARRGLRVNINKITPEMFERIAPFPVSRVPWVGSGFYYTDDVRPARHPYYRAGLYYLQEPSAMTPADRLPVFPGERVLDLCAAPGGKATQLAGRLSGTGTEYAPGRASAEYVPDREASVSAPLCDGGLLVANEISTSRARALLRNLELAGTGRCFVTNEHAGNMAAAFPEYFDKILVDAPCSGEGMFHRQPEVAEAWTPERSAYFANLQRSILEEAVRMLRPGGLMMYSTCTFSVEENEGAVAHFLSRHPMMHTIAIEPYEGFAPGLPELLRTQDTSVVEEGDFAREDLAEEIRRCVRIWPHKMGGEGHFLALMRKDGGADLHDTDRIRREDSASETEIITGTYSYGTAKENGQRRAEENGRRRTEENRRGKTKESRSGKIKGNRRGRTGGAGDDAQQVFDRFLEEMGIKLPAGRIDIRKDRIYLVPELPDSVSSLKFIRNGVFLGELKKDRFEPAQPFALLPCAASCREDAMVNFNADDPRLMTYLEGGTITFDREEDRPEKNGWKLVCADGYGIGWARYAAGVLKNKYPVSWR